MKPGNKLVYDAQTAIGGSGGPVLGSNGKVVAINTALLKGFAGSNFGIPITRAIELQDNLPAQNSVTEIAEITRTLAVFEEKLTRAAEKFIDEDLPKQDYDLLRKHLTAGLQSARDRRAVLEDSPTGASERARFAFSLLSDLPGCYESARGRLARPRHPSLYGFQLLEGQGLIRNPAGSLLGVLPSFPASWYKKGGIAKIGSQEHLIGL